MTGPLRIPGQSIGGEDRREAAWRATIAEAARAVGSPGSCPGIVLSFVIAPGRRVDIDNLTRPVMAALRDAGWFKYAFAGLDRIVATKAFGDDEGVTIAVEPGFRPPMAWSSSTLTVRHGAVPGSDHRDALRRWFEAVASFGHRPVDGLVAVEVDAGTSLSLVGVMKPIIDGLEPVLGRDPAGKSEFAPLDDRVMRLVMQRTNEGSGLVVRVGPSSKESAH